MGSTELTRLAVLSDMDVLLKMGAEFFDASGYSDITTFNKDDLEVLMKELISLGTLLINNRGAMLGFVVYPLFMNKSHLVSQELFWWVNENVRYSGVGIEILKQAEKLSSEHGAKTMMMLSIDDLNGKKVSKLYEKLGYKKREQTFMRAI